MDDRAHNRPAPTPDSEEFLAFYQQQLEQGVADEDMPEWASRLYRFESCLKHREDKQVYLVSDRRTGGRAILRVMGVEGLRRDRLQRDLEYLILSALDFPGVPKVFGSHVDERRSYLVREYFPGRPLDAVLASQGPLDTASIAAFGRQLCTILDYLHKCTPPVVHRDIKPGNIIVMPYGQLGLTDFGIARVYKDHSDSDTSYEGTLLYAPPEQFGFAQSSPLSDIYALGIVMLCMATGSPVRYGLDEGVRDKRLKALIERCIAFDPQDRFQSAAELAERLERVGSRALGSRLLGSRPTSSRPTGSRPPGSRPPAARVAANPAPPASTTAAPPYAAPAAPAEPKRTVPVSPPVSPPAPAAAPPRRRRLLAVGAAALILIISIGIGAYVLTRVTPGGDDEQLADVKGSWGEGPSNPMANPHPVGSPANPNQARPYRLGDPLIQGQDIGNLGGNTSNGGLAAEANDGIYVALDDRIIHLSFAGEQKGDTIVVSNPRSLSFYQGFLYFAADEGICRYDPVSQSTAQLDRAQADYLYLLEGRLFYSADGDSSRLYELALDGSGRPTLCSTREGHYRNTIRGLQFYTTAMPGRIVTTMADDYPSSASITLPDIESASYLSIYSTHIYFCDSTAESVLAGCKLDGDDYYILAHGPCERIVACPYGVFYLSPATGQLIAFSFATGSERTVVGYGVDTYCLAGEWVIYRTRSEAPELRMVRFDGSDDRLLAAPTPPDDEAPDSADDDTAAEDDSGAETP